jgi:membrane protein
MAVDRAALVAVPRDVVAVLRARNVPFMAGSIAYNAFVSLIPLLILAFVLVTAAGDQQLAGRVVEATGGVLPQSAQEPLGETIAGGGESGDEEQTSGVSVIGFVTLSWGALKIFRGLDTAFSEIYGTEARDSFLDQLRDGVVVLVVLLVVIVAAVAAGGAATVLPIPYLDVVSPLVLLGVLTAAFAPMFYLFPDVDHSFREVLPGAAFAAVGWATLEALFQVYVAFAGKADAYGVLGAVLLLVTWLYFSGLVILTGATINAVLADRAGRDADRDAETGTGYPGGDADPAAGASAAVGGGDEGDVGGDGERERGDDPSVTAPLRAADRTAARIEAAAARRKRSDLERRVADLERRVADLASERDRLAEENRRLRRELRGRSRPLRRRLSRLLPGD